MFIPSQSPVFFSMIAAIGTAFAVLSDEEKRKHYNRFGDDDGPQVRKEAFVDEFLNKKIEKNGKSNLQEKNKTEQG